MNQNQLSKPTILKSPSFGGVGEVLGLNITVIGGGPGGLYFSILTKKAMPHWEISVYEQNKADDSFGFGVVFSDETLGEFLTRDEKSYELIRSEFAYWDDIIIARDGETVSISGNGFCGCSRKTLLQLLQKRCVEEGVNLYFETKIEDISILNADVIVACDGINSAIRSQFSKEFGTKIAFKKNKFVWLGSTKPLDAFTYFFRTTAFGTIVAHTYQYQEGMSTWIFECNHETWEKHGFETQNEAETIQKISKIFKEELDGHSLISNRSHWRQFPEITNEKWHHNNIVLLGDAKATAHFSIGSGTKLAMESAISLSDALVGNPENIELAFQNYEKSRRNKVEIIQNAANVSLDWFENMNRNNQHDFLPFAFGCMTRSKKVTFENLAIRDKSFTDKVLEEFNNKQHPSDSELAKQTINNKQQTPAAFTPFSLRKMNLINRIVMAPMSQKSSVDGMPNDWHFVHYTSRALGGVGLIITELTAISKEARNSEDAIGIYTESQIVEWKRITDFIHKNTQTKIGIQLGHCGRKGRIKDENDLFSASPIPFSANSKTPKEMTVEDMNLVIADFVQATKNVEKAGFDMIELQAHHGFLLASFLSPLTNIRTDEFGGSIENRLKFPLEIFKNIRENFDKNKPISIRISATDWAENGITEAAIFTICEAFKTAGADIISVSTGNTVENQQSKLGRMYQVPFSDAIKNSVQIPTITAGMITDIDQINTILLSKKADLVALGKPLLLDPNFVRNAQAYENFIPTDIPNQYEIAIKSLFSSKQSERRMIQGMKKALKPISHKKITN